ncbi:hypothetical protein FOA43_002505 [Brettanomyces nanus]|uniref:GTP-binding protein n=1 Tax=Eeniella nana TaxID=13502 RepID=A0A875RPK3_EENNA|nr:uncharacterized protein FOA43_002505 [Brettanomyces nanus]QPG75160.1 hypothetical protein FOA43_002505 [Brettanomyces nanus]
MVVDENTLLLNTKDAQKKPIDGYTRSDSRNLKASNKSKTLTGNSFTQKSGINEDSVILKIYDLSGQYKKQHLWKEYLASHGTKINCIVYMVDVSDTLTLDDSISKLIDIINYNNESLHIPLVIIFNKIDIVKDLEGLIRERQQKQNQLQQLLQLQLPQRNQASSSNSSSSSPSFHSRNGSDSISSQLAPKLSEGSIHHNRARILLEGTGCHRLLLDYIGITSDNGRLYLNRPKTTHLNMDLGLFVLSLKDDRPDLMTDSLDDVLNWIIGDIRH